MAEETPSPTPAPSQTWGSNWQPLDELPKKTRKQEAKHGSFLKNITIGLVDVYSKCTEDFNYSLSLNPKRTLTFPTEGVHNGGYDNVDHNYICHVGDSIVNQAASRSYEILENLGQGSFGQVVKCQLGVGTAPVALKISKNKPAYFNQGCSEAEILKRLNTEFDPSDSHHIVRILDYFVHKKHLCIAFELLSMNLFEFLKWNNYRGLAMPTICTVTKQLLKALSCVSKAALIHCDLKPENVMIYSLDPIKIKLIDFGSACNESHVMHSYIQSRFYRSPEVLLGLPYGNEIDIWSLGCMVAELFLGLPIFPGQSEYDQVCLIHKVLGSPPIQMLNAGNKTKRFFRRVEELLDGPSKAGKPVGPSDLPVVVTCAADDTNTPTTQAPSNEEASGYEKSAPPEAIVATIMAPNGTGSPEEAADEYQAEVLPDALRRPVRVPPPRRPKKTSWRLKTSEDYERDEHKKAVTSSRKWNFTSLPQMVEHIKEEERRLIFLQFLQGVFQLNPKDRWSANQALQHAFVNPEAKYEADFKPTTEEVRPHPMSAVAAGAMAGVASGGYGQGHMPHMVGSHYAPSSATGTPASVSSSAAMFTGASTQGGTTQGGSPWHLPSPGGDPSTGSDCWGFSGSDEVRSRGSLSQSDTGTSVASGSYRGRVGPVSDSDSCGGTCSSAGGTGSNWSGVEHDSAQRGKGPPKIWKSISRGELASRLSLSLDSTLSPKAAAGSIAVGGSFREAVGMGESGPVVPLGPNAHHLASAMASGGSEDSYHPDGHRSGRGKGGHLRPRGRRRKGPSHWDPSAQQAWSETPAASGSV